MIEQKKLEALKTARNEAMQSAIKAAYEYCCACEIGPEREKAFEIYENLRNSGRVYA